MKLSSLLRRSRIAAGVSAAGVATLFVAPGNPLAFAQAPSTAQSVSSAATKATITVRISGLRNSKGKLNVLLFNSDGAKGFPGAADKAVGAREVDLQTSGGGAVDTPPSSPVVVTFADLPPGAYAVAVHHDANANKKLDTHWYGKPKEGIAASNNPRPKRRAPRFNEAKFDLPGAGVTVDLAMWY